MGARFLPIKVTFPIVLFAGPAGNVSLLFVYSGLLNRVLSVLGRITEVFVLKSLIVLELRS